MTQPLRFPTPDWQPRATPQPNSFPVPAFSLGLLCAVVLFTVGVLSGRAIERGSQLGQVLALAPALDELHGAVLRSDSTLARLDALGRPQKRSPVALQRQRPPATPTDSLSRHP